MYCSMWLLTTTCLACGAPESAAAGAAQPGPVPLVNQVTNPGYQDYPQATGSQAVAGPCASGCAEACPCAECPGLFARVLCRLRTFFHRSCKSCTAPCETSRLPVCEQGHDCGGFAPRLRRYLACLFRRPCSEAACCEPVQEMIVQTPPTAVLPPPQPPSASEPVSLIQPVAATPAPAATPPAMEIAKEYLDKVGNAEDYAWITGQLFYIHIHADQGLWVVRYAPVDKEDRYGGSVVLALATDLGGCREGDLVTVHGEILNQGRASRYLGGPLYRALEVELKGRNRP